jgi:hypothetical protein
MVVVLTLRVNFPPIRAADIISGLNLKETLPSPSQFGEPLKSLLHGHRGGGNTIIGK